MTASPESLENMGIPACAPEHALAWSDDIVGRGGLRRPLLALWRPLRTTAVIGLAQRPEREVAPDPAGKPCIGVVRRQSGGGAVLLYPGVLCWEAIAPQAVVAAAAGGDAGIRQAYAFLCRPVVAGLGRFGVRAFAAGISDLAVAAEPGGVVKKIAGTAQLRRRDHVLVHGALLVAADIAVMSRYLAEPEEQPAYRRGRPHGDFCTTLSDIMGTDESARGGLIAAVGSAIQGAAARDAWNVVDIPDRLGREAETLRDRKYLDAGWTWRTKRPAPGAGRPYQPG